MYCSFRSQKLVALFGAGIWSRHVLEELRMPRARRESSILVLRGGGESGSYRSDLESGHRLYYPGSPD